MKGNATTAEDFAEKALRLSLFDPLSYFALHAMGTVRVRRGQFDDAAAYYLKATQANPRFSVLYALHTAALAQAGRLDEARLVASSTPGGGAELPVGSLRIGFCPGFAYGPGGVVCGRVAKGRVARIGVGEKVARVHCTHHRDLQARVDVASSRPLCANSGHSSMAWRTGQIDPKRALPVRVQDGKNAHQSGHPRWEQTRKKEGRPSEGPSFKSLTRPL